MEKGLNSQLNSLDTLSKNTNSMTNTMNPDSGNHQAASSSSSAPSPLEARHNLGKHLDCIDQVQRILHLGKDDREFFDKIQNDIPQFIVAGPQSVGKSSVIARLSGIKLPTHHKRCTLVPTMLKIRRESVAKDIQVKLIHPKRGGEGTDGKDDKPSETSFSLTETETTTTALIKKAQEMATEESGQSFAPDHVIEISTSSPQFANMTIWDQPGFITTGNEDVANVQNMVEKYIKRDRTLVLQVAMANQDYESVTGNDFLIKFKHKCTSVFTHLDCLKIDAQFATPDQIKDRFDNIIQHTQEPRFAVLGNFEGSFEEEVERLRRLECFQLFPEYLEHFRLGAKNLMDHIETITIEHLARAIPDLLNRLETKLKDATTELESKKKRSEWEVVSDVCDIIRKRLTSKQHEEALKQFIDSAAMELKARINSLGLNTLDNKHSTHYLRDLDKSEMLEAGTEVYIDRESQPECVKAIVVKSGGPGFHVVKAEDQEGEEKVENATLYSTDTRMFDMVKEIDEFIRKDSGLHNPIFRGSREIIDRYAGDYAKRYGKLLQSAGEKCESFLKNEIMAKVFKPRDQIDRDVFSHLKTVAMAELAKIKVLFDALTQFLIASNTPPHLTFTANDHYLDSLIVAGLALNNQATTDLAAATKFYHELRAYMKVQRKVIVDSALKGLVYHFQVMFSRQVLAAMEGMAHDQLVGKVAPESPDVEKHRQRLGSRVRVLKEAIGELSKMHVGVHE